MLRLQWADMLVDTQPKCTDFESIHVLNVCSPPIGGEPHADAKQATKHCYLQDNYSTAHNIPSTS